MAAVAAATIVDAPNVIAQPKIQWRMSTAWPPALKVMQGSAVRLRKIVEEMTSGRFRIEVFAGGKPPRAPSKPSWLLRPTGRTGSSRSSGSRPSRSAWIPRAWRPGATRAMASSSGRRPTRPSTSWPRQGPAFASAITKGSRCARPSDRGPRLSRVYFL